METENWIIVGTGWISKDFVIGLEEADQNVVGVLSRTINRAKEFIGDADIKPFDDIKKINVEYDNVYIATPNSTHYGIAKEFIKLGKNVLIEKIMTDSPAKTKELFKLADEMGVKIMEAYSHIYPGAYEGYLNCGGNVFIQRTQISSHIKNGTTATASSFSKKLYGGVGPDLAVYPMSMAIFINGPVESMEVTKLEKWTNGIDIEVEFTLHHKNGATTKAIASKINDGENGLIIDGVKIKEAISEFKEHFHMYYEINTFLDGDYKFSRDISIQVAELVDQIKNLL